MSDRVFFSLMALIALALVSLSLVWPQGLGTRSPGLFGHDVAAAPTPQPTATNPK